MSRTASLLLIIFAWLAVSLITTSQGILTYLATSGTVNVRATLLVNLSLWLPWAILSPAILAAARRWPLTPGPAWRPVALHLAANVALAVVAALIYRSVRVALGIPVRANYGLLLVSGLNTALIVYWGLVALQHGLASRRRAVERDRLAAEMQRQLTAARLDALRAQIHPHFLFNTAAQRTCSGRWAICFARP